MANKEYLIQGAIHRQSGSFMEKEWPWYRIEETSDGYDEYDALERLIKRYVKEDSVSENDFYAEVRIRPTGRRGSIPFFPEQKNEHPHNKGLLSRFWIRFSLSETEEELKKYGEHFNSFVQDSGFSEASLKRMRVLYAKQLHHIRNGSLMPETYQLKVVAGSPEVIVESCSRQAADYLRLFGYRVTKSKNGYEVKSLGCHTTYSNQVETNVFSALELVLYWQWITQKRELKVDDIFHDMGYVIDNKEYEYEQILRDKNIAAYVVRDDVGVPSICVLKEQQAQAYGIVRGLKARIVDDYTDPDAYELKSDGLGDNYNRNLENMLDK
ncbi:hypothetical protein SAMN03159341_12938 [Paenibacillus sp. 1_12]|uniref:hypothetical protein n=1 Tax=Paenibacillus sp. 1_12 TaxID=1566278 RepID=UPI0008E2298F|nr:hypothetical protein [Paenibacillus sp. 1_12]SFM37843.1 hypothetical protein SAMN03159341_12938 [Paenibacillus sp. 1_12]